MGSYFDSYDTSDSDPTLNNTYTPPVPGQGYSTSGGAQYSGSSGAPSPKQPRQSGGKALLFGILGGFIGAAALFAVLYFTGILGSSSTSNVGSNTQSGANSTSTQNVTINATDVDATTATAVASKCLSSVVSVYVSSSEGEGTGSGVILDTTGNILTNYHVVDGATAISVTIDGKSYAADLVGTDSSSDLAVIKADLEGDSVTPMEIGDSDALQVGDWVMSIGSPFGYEQSVSVGVVSALSRNTLMTSSSGNTIYANLIQTDAAINPGNSGGALVNSLGQLVGICALYSSSTESSASVGFAIPGNYAINIANQIIAGETVLHAYIGLTMSSVNAQSANSYGLSVNQGAYVVEVTSGSPADVAGIEVGDVIVAMDGEEITSADGMILAVRAHSIGQTVTVTVMRGTQELTFEVTLGSDEALQTTTTDDNSSGDSGLTYEELEKWYEEFMEQFQRRENGNGFGYGAPGSDTSTNVMTDDGTTSVSSSIATVADALPIAA